MRSVVLRDYLLKRFILNTSIKQATLRGCLLFLQVPKKVGHELMRVMLQDRMELLRDGFLQMIDLYHRKLSLESTLIE